MTAAERVAALESGEAEPTDAMLFKMRKKYRVPSVVFFMDQTPFETHRGYDFRTLPHGGRADTEAVLNTLSTKVWAGQGMVSDLREDENVLPLPFIGSGQMKSGRTAIVDLLRELLGVCAEDAPGQYADFDLLRDLAEKAGVFVLLKGDLGSYHTAIGVDVFRGLAISDELAPYVVVNDRAPRPTWTLILLHELAHLILGQTGFCNGRVDKETERFCEGVAVEFLLPALDPNRIESDDCSEVVAIRDSLVSALPNGGRLRYDGFNGTGDSRIYYARLRYKLGNALVGLIGRSLKSGDLTPTRASRMLGVKAHQVYRVIDAPMPTMS